MSFVDALIILGGLWALGTLIAAMVYAIGYTVEKDYDDREARRHARRMFTAYLWPFWAARALFAMHRDAFEPQDRA